MHGVHHQGTLFETLEVEPQQLQEPRYQAYVIYHCSAVCPGHRQMLLDWELERLSLRHQNDSDAQAQEAIYKKYENVLAPEKNLYCTWVTSKNIDSRTACWGSSAPPNRLKLPQAPDA